MLHIRANKAHVPRFVPPYSARGRARLPALLIVDDDAQVLRMSRRLLGGAWQIETAGNASEALDLIKERHFDVLLSDFDMPGRDGLWLLEQARRYQPRLRRVLYSGSGPRDLSDHLRSGLVHCFVAKPSCRDELMNALKEEHRLRRN
jgi:DNA-binding NtrC family response regulator